MTAAANAILTALVDADWDHMDGWSAGGWIAMAIGMILFWALVVLGVVWLLRAQPWNQDRREDPLDLLDRRLAEGAISAEDYRERRAILRGEGPQDN